MLAEIAAVPHGRFQALAAISTSAPSEAAVEPERAVTRLGLPGAMLYGRTGEANADSREFGDLYATAEPLGVPLQFHPQIARPGVLADHDGGLEGTVEVGEGGPYATGHGAGHRRDRLVLRDRHPAPAHDLLRCLRPLFRTFR
jgi:predicted TIM-barrel fold metal-dependent hydrolase